MADLEYAWFKKKALDIAGLDLNSYKPEQMKRLLEKIMTRYKVRNYVELIKYINGSPVRIQEFRDDITINVSHLFRDYPIWMELKKVLEGAVERKARHSGGAPFRVWSAGCSIGAEPCTLSILLTETIHEHTRGRLSFNILCTDLDHGMLRRAREGIFMAKETEEVPEPLMKKYFRQIDRPLSDWAQRSAETDFYQIDSALVGKMNFMYHNLLDDTWEQGFDLITCRNVLIYFTNDIKEKLFQKFSVSLNEGGILFIGGTEIMFRSERYGFENAGSGIYLKKLEQGG